VLDVTFPKVRYVPEAAICYQTRYKISGYSMWPVSHDLRFPGAGYMHQENSSLLDFTVAKVMYQQIKGW